MSIRWVPDPNRTRGRRYMLMYKIILMLFYGIETYSPISNGLMRRLLISNVTVFRGIIILFHRIVIKYIYQFIKS